MYNAPHASHNSFFSKKDEPIVSIKATPTEIIVLQAALHHYRDYIGYDKDLQARAAPLIQHFIQRLHDQLPPAKDQIETL